MTWLAHGLYPPPLGKLALQGEPHLLAWPNIPSLTQCKPASTPRRVFSASAEWTRLLLELVDCEASRLQFAQCLGSLSSDSLHEILQAGRLRSQLPPTRHFFISLYCPSVLPNFLQIRTMSVISWRAIASWKNRSSLTSDGFLSPTGRHLRSVPLMAWGGFYGPPLNANFCRKA